MTPSPPNLQRIDDPGIASSFDRPLDRVMGKDGRFAVHRVGESRGVSEGFVKLATMPPARLILVVVGSYLTMNLFFGSLYMAVGVEQLGNANLSTAGTRWLSAIGMSVQTLTTVGYGSLYPTTAATWLLAAIEGVFGILGFSIISALLFTRFARPTTRLAYSAQALMAPFKDGWSLQMRVANRRSSLLVEIEARVLLVMQDPEQPARLDYFTLPLQFNKVSFMPLSWTLVHPINAESPLAGLSAADLERRRAELIVILKALDEAYMQTVITRHSFRFDEIVWGGKYERAYSSQNGKMQLDLNKLSHFTPLEAPERMPQ
jgi:inward rectifier potassium channel